MKRPQGQVSGGRVNGADRVQPFFEGDASNDAIARGGKWPAAIDKEMDNHRRNGSWNEIPISEVPRGRKIHKFTYVFKDKRDGTCKCRLTVQGGTMTRR